MPVIQRSEFDWTEIRSVAIFGGCSNTLKPPTQQLSLRTREPRRGRILLAAEGQRDTIAPLYFHRAFSILRELRKFDMKADAIQNQICISCSEISAQVQNVILRPIDCCRVLNATNCPCAV